MSLIAPNNIGNLYLLRLTYKIRPLEKQLPSAGDCITNVARGCSGSSDASSHRT